MRATFCFLLLLISPVLAHAAPSSVWWPQWTIESSEELWDEVGHKYSSYPIPLMLDGNTKTAWVDSARQHDTLTFPSRFGFIFKPSTLVTPDALRIMNGNNRSRARFFGNHRVTKIRVTQFISEKQKIVTEAKLSDAMGWHVIKLPRHKIKSLKIEFPEIAPSKSKHADVCISELELWNSGKKIDWLLPRAVMYYDGLEGCGASLLISHHGKVLDGIATDAGYDDTWSRDGRYVAGLNGGGGKDYLEHVWIADVWRGKIIREIKTLGHGANYQWRNSRTLMVDYEKNKKTRRRFLKAPSFR